MNNQDSRDQNKKTDSQKKDAKPSLSSDKKNMGSHNADKEKQE